MQKKLRTKNEESSKTEKRFGNGGEQSEQVEVHFDI